MKLTLRQRIYYAMMALLLITFAVSGITAYVNFRSQEEEYNRQRLKRKEQSVQESMRYFLDQQGGRIQPDSVAAYFEDKLIELSDVHRLAINLYNLRGELLVSSSPDNMRELGFAETIDYTVMKQLSTGNTRAEQKRDIDYGTFIMAYWYISDADGKPLAITNVRYDKQEIDKGELRDFLIRLTQVYLVLFIAAGVLAFLLSNYITVSLQKIGKRIQSVDLSQDAEPIEWRGEDEIGALVTAYNRMLDEVRRSAEKLARTERESAWREMAKQVAHEIKNPLTPMKLRVQHLQRSLSPSDADFKKKLEVFSESMIEQIESLSKIAGEFSDFAKMPKAKLERVEVASLLRKCINLFIENAEVNIVYNENTDPKHTVVLSDREQLLRVFNNLVTNAIQAIPADREGRVIIEIKSNSEWVTIKVIDNGSGIPPEMQDRIFVPNFTTKSTGTGLGLAIVRNIVEQVGGSIDFTTQVGEGTSFTVHLPRIAPDDSE